MADEDSTNLPEPEQETKGINPFNFSFADIPSDNDFNFDSDSDDSLSDGETKDKDKNEPLIYTRQDDEVPEEDNSPEANLKRFSDVLGGRRMRRLLKEEDEEYVYSEDLYDFPKDPERWKEEDLEEIWADPPLETEKTGWDPVWADEDDWDIVQDELADGKDPDIAPFYIPYRKPYPVIPDNHFDISSPKSVVEELDRIEEFLIWVSYIFPDGSSYEGTVWDDLAHGKGVYVAEEGLVRYEGEWLQNNMEGHGVVEVEIPDIEPVPGSKLEAKMRAHGKIISRDFMSPEDKKWLEMDIEDSIRVADGEYEIPFYENKEWINQFGSKPEKGRYRYAGQWKHSRMHGCGVYTLNERTIYGRFYFGELVDDEDDDRCDVNISAMHAGIAEVAAAKSRMFVNKPDGMVREQRGPYSDPQHPYFYEEEDAWMAPGFINQFYDVPDYWKTYVHDVDQEREMWLNSFYKAPLRLPMPAELEYWWSKDERPEFILINKEPEPDPEDPTKLIYTEDPLILHTTTGRLINYIEDEEHGLRLFWQPPLEEGEEVDPEKVEFLPLGFDEFYGREASVKKETIWMRLITGVENACKPGLDKLGKWIEEKKKGSEMKIKLMEQELECVEAEICLEEIIEDIAADLKKKEKEEEKKAQMGLLEEEDTSAAAATQDEKASAEEEVEEDEEEEEEDDDDTPSSFGFVNADQNTAKDEQKGKNPGKSPFSTTSLSFASCSLASMLSSKAPPKLHHSFLSWKKGRSLLQTTPSCNEDTSSHLDMSASVSFPRVLSQNGSLRAAKQGHWNFQMGSRSKRSTSQLHSLSRVLCGNPKTSLKEQRLRNHNWLHPEPESESDNILSLHIPVFCLESYTDVK